MRFTIPLLAFFSACSGSVSQNPPEVPVKVEAVSFEGTGDTCGRDAYARLRNTTAEAAAVEIRFRFRTDNGLELIGPSEVWTPVQLAPGETRAFKTSCPFSTAAKAECLVRKRQGS